MPEFRISSLRFNYTGQWATTTTYNRDAVITYQGKMYVCLVPHTSGDFYQDLYHVTGAGASTPYWNLILDGKTWTNAWSPSTYYSLGNIVTYGGAVYVCTANHTSSTTLDLSKFTTLATFTNWHTAWLPNTNYGVGDAVKYGGIVYVCNTNHTSAASATLGLEANQSSWTILNQGIDYKGPWLASFRYKVQDVVKVDANLYICTIAHTSGPVMAAGNFSLFLPGEEYLGTWNSGTAYQPGDVVQYGGYDYICLTNNNTNNIPNTDATDWALFNQGYLASGDWTGGTSYQIGDVVRRNGELYVAIANSTSQDPNNYSSAVTYNSTGSSGSTVIVSSIYTLVPGMIAIGSGFASGQSIISASLASSVTTTVASAAVTVTATGTSGSPTITVTSNAGLVVGMNVSASGIAGGTTIQNIATNTITLSANTVSAVSGLVSFGTNAITVGSTSGIAVNQGVIGAGINGLSQVASISGSTVILTYPATGTVAGNGTFGTPTVVLSSAPDSALTNGQTINFYGVNSTSWNLIVPGAYWASFWNSTTTYLLGDLVIWQNATYRCIQASPKQSRPDQDTTNQYWIPYVLHARHNALNTVGNITYNISTTTPTNTALPIGTTGQLLRSTIGATGVLLPTWSTINQTKNVFYVAPNGVDNSLTNGTTWDQPFASIAYACNYVLNGTLYPNTANILTKNKLWIVTEMYNYLVYSLNNNLNGVTNGTWYTSSVGPSETIRDAEYIIDAIVYDITRGGNSQTVAAAQSYFAFGSVNSFISTIVAADMPNFVIALNYMYSLINNVLNQSAPANNYQALNGIAAGSRINQVVGLNGVESQTTLANPLAPNGAGNTYVDILFNLIYNSLASQSTTNLPTPNSGISSTIYVKTGTYTESLPIVVPENCALVGDELRGVVVQPKIIYNTYTTISTAATQLFTVSSTTGLYDGCPIQFVTTNNNLPVTLTAFESAITAGQTYYVVGSTVTSSNFAISSSSTPAITVTGALGSTITVTSSAGLTVGAPIAFNTGFGNIIPGAVYYILTTATGAITVSTTPNGLAYAVGSVSNLSQTQGSLVTGSVLITLSGGNGLMQAIGGHAIVDMFRMRNGSGLRNMSLVGKLGTLTAQNQYATQRPTGNAYVALDPGTGPSDTTAWIFRRSPYVQNVTTFGVGSVGCKIDGTLHNGGNKSIVSNDFTQVISDGIGIWCYGPGALTECVSVFSYYAYTSYFAEAGGKIRATNGNSSYGTFGLVAEGYDTTETPISATVNNQYGPATVIPAFTYPSAGSYGLMKYTYTNAGQNYVSAVTNLLQYSNNFQNGAWINDGNITFTENTVSPDSLADAWTFISATGGTDTSYLYQNVSVTPQGTSFTNVAGSNISGSGAGALFNITINATSYSVTVASGGSGYVVGNQIKIYGSQLGGVNVTNDLTITVTNLTGSAISTPSGISSAGTVPAGSNQPYILSLHVKQGTASAIDLYAFFTGTSTRASAVTFNFSTATLIPSSQDGSGLLPTQYGVNTLQNGWYRIWFSVYDTTAQNTNLQYRIYPRTRFGTIGNTYVYGAQLERSASLGFYLTNTSGLYTAYADYIINSSGTGVQTVGDEIRSNSVFQTRMIDNGNGVGGLGYLTASNNAQGGSSSTGYITLAQSDVNSATNYIGMRIFINSGTGVGQYGFISSYNASNKYTTVLKESFAPVLINASSSATNAFSLDPSADVNTLYVNQPIQFVPNYYNSIVTQTSQATVTVTATTGGQINTIYTSGTSVLSTGMAITFSNAFTYTTSATQTSAAGNLVTLSNTAGITIGMPIVFNGTAFGNIVAGNTYYVLSIPTPGVGGTITIGQYVGGATLALTNGSGILTVTAGGIFGGLVSGYTYYISNILDNNTIQVSATQSGSILSLYTAVGNMSLNYPSNTGYMVGSTTNMSPNMPIQFTGNTLGGVVAGTLYYVNNVISSTQFTISTALVTTTATATATSVVINTVTYPNVITVTATTNLVPCNPIVFSGTTFGSVVAGTTYYIANIPDTYHIQLATSLINTTATSTAAITNLITVTSTTGFIAGNPIFFTGNSFGGLVSETQYYILAINNATTFTISNTVGGSAVALSTATGYMTIRTAPTTFTLTAVGSGSMTLTSTTAKKSLTSGYGSMSTLFQTPLFGGVTQGTTYYVLAINAGSTNTFTITATSNGVSAVTLASSTGSMQMGQVGWDHVIAGTPPVSVFDTSTIYYIEPRLTYSQPAFTQTYLTLPSQSAGAGYTAIAYGANYFIAVPAGGSTIIGSSDGNNWSSITIPFSAAWTGVAYGQGTWVIISTGGTSIPGSFVISSNSSGQSWKTAYLPSISTWTNIVYGNGTFVAIASGTSNVAYSTSYGSTWSSGSGLPNTTWTGLAYGANKWVAVASGGTQSAYSINNGASWTSGTLPVSTAWSSVAYGNGRFVAVSSTSATPAYSFDGITWYTSTYSITATSITYGQGVFTAVNSGNATCYTSEDGNFWKIRTGVAITSAATAFGFTGTAYVTGYNIGVAGSGYLTAPTLTFSGGGATVQATATCTILNGGIAAVTIITPGSGYTSTPTITVSAPPSGGTTAVVTAVMNTVPYTGIFVTVGGTGGVNSGSITSAGAQTKGRPNISAGTMATVYEFEPGSGYTSTPTLSIFDPNNTSTAPYALRTANGVLATPTFVSNGAGYTVSGTSIAVNGSGSADQYQNNYNLYINNLSNLPRPGDDLVISNNSTIYKVTSATGLYGTTAPNFTALLTISPSMSTLLAPSTGTALIIREKYSQVRATNHDFLNIGYGDQYQSNYPGVPVPGTTLLSPQNQTIENNYGRVFYTSTDQDGNFKVGNLFGVQQATGTVTISASQFGLQGLNQLTLGGISVGGSSVIITQFSTDGTFVANSDNILSTQKAVKTYLAARLSQGGSNTFTGNTTAGTVTIGGPNIIGSTVVAGTPGSSVKIPVTVHMQGPYAGVDGGMMAQAFFIKNFAHR